MHYVLEKINYLREQKGWSEYKLSVVSGISQTTINAWYRKNMLPSIFSLERICDAFEVTMSYFFADNDENIICLTDKQKHLVDLSTKLSDRELAALLELLNCRINE